MLWHSDKYKERSVETHLLNLTLTFAIIMLPPAEMSFAMPPELPVSLHAVGVVSSCAPRVERNSSSSRARKEERR